MIHYYDRLGNPIGRTRWLRLFEDRKYRFLASDNIAHLWVSTVWLGLDHSVFGAGPPLIFETMVFNTENLARPYDPVETRRYSTEAQALAGHAQILELVTLLESANTEIGETDDTATSTDEDRDASIHDHVDRGGGA